MKIDFFNNNYWTISLQKYSPEKIISTLCGEAVFSITRHLQGKHKLKKDSIVDYTSIKGIRKSRPSKRKKKQCPIDGSNAMVARVAQHLAQIHSGKKKREKKEMRQMQDF